MSHKHDWHRIKLYVGVYRLPTKEVIEECRALLAKPDISFEEKRRVLEQLSVQVWVGDGPHGPDKGICISDFLLCNCGARAETAEKQ